MLWKAVGDRLIQVEEWTSALSVATEDGTTVRVGEKVVTVSSEGRIHLGFDSSLWWRDRSGIWTLTLKGSVPPCFACFLGMAINDIDVHHCEIEARFKSYLFSHRKQKDDEKTDIS
jgi:hypothetical protein